MNSFVVWSNFGIREFGSATHNHKLISPPHEKRQLFSFGGAGMLLRVR